MALLESNLDAVCDHLRVIRKETSTWPRNDAYQAIGLLLRAFHVEGIWKEHNLQDSLISKLHGFLRPSIDGSVPRSLYVATIPLRNIHWLHQRYLA